MRWRVCDCCDIPEEVRREDKSTSIIFECHCCWNDYCDTCGDNEIRICDRCLDEAYICNYGHPYATGQDDPMGIKSAPEYIKEQAIIVHNWDFSDYE